VAGLRHERLGQRASGTGLPPARRAAFGWERSKWELLWDVHALALARTNNACSAEAGAVAHVDVGKAGFRQLGAMLSLGVGLSVLVHAEKRKVYIHGLRRR